MERLECHVKDYAWGKNGSDSEVARLFASGHKEFSIGQNTPYAELWMGTHPDGPARVRSTSDKLSRHIAKTDSSKKLQKEEIHLPFIMKIMSIKHTLSLQVHPTKEQAARLHQKDPKNYPDSHHKPELAYALTRFELLCGFRPAEEILKNMKAFPELKAVMGEAACDQFEKLYKAGYSQDSIQLKNALSRIFANMLYIQVDEPDFVTEQLKSLYNRLAKKVRGCLIEDTVRVMEKMYNDFPNDVGCFSPLYLNHMILEPGECCFYAAEELHAYLSGECVECVGCSNNTIRAALTPKFIDREALIEVLNYRMTKPEFYMVNADKLDGFPHVVEYAPDCKDFTLHQIEITTDPKSPSSQLPAKLPTLECGSIMVIVEGEGYVEDSTTNTPKHVTRGDIFYIRPSCTVHFTSITGNRLLAYRTFSHEEGPDHSNRKTIPVFPQTVTIEDRFSSKKNIIPIGKEKVSFGMEIFDVESEMDGFC